MKDAVSAGWLGIYTFTHCYQNKCVGFNKSVVHRQTKTKFGSRAMSFEMKCSIILNQNNNENQYALWLPKFMYESYI